MREIKFDAIYKPTGEHFTPVNINFESKTTHGNFDGQVNDWCHFSLDGKNGDAILRQYTELKDKNGKEIYEGDILQNDRGTILKVLFEEGAFCATGTDALNKSRVFSLLYDFYGWSSIIGNIYENQELIKN